MGTSEIADNSITDAVGASELQGVTKLQFTTCSFTDTFGDSPGAGFGKFCTIQGLTSSDRVIVTKKEGNPCYADTRASLNRENQLVINVVNVCSSSQVAGTMTFNVIVYPG